MTPYRTTLYTLTLSLLCTQTGLAASDDLMITEEDLYTDLHVVTGASQISQLLTNAPVSATIIDRQMIAASGAQNWADLFRLVPGMQAYSINANRFGISYHGIGHEFPNHLKVRVDGRSVYEPLFSTVNWNSLAINLDDIERIEVIRGANAPSDGSNAFLGAINIITREPIQDRGLTIRGTYDSRGTRETSARYNGSMGNLDYRWSAAFQQNDGFTDVPKSPVDDGQNLRHSEFRGTYHGNDGTNIEFHLSHSNSDTGFGDADRVNEYATVHFNQQFQSVKWQQLLDDGNELQLHLYHNKLAGDNSVPLGNLSELVVAAGLTADIDSAIALLAPFGGDGLFVSGFRNVESERYDIELSHTLSLSDNIRTARGVGVRHETIDAEALLEPEEEVSQNRYRLFGNMEWQPTTQWVINAGVMVENNNTVNTIASPRLGINYLLNDHHTLRFTTSYGRRSPSLLEANEFNVDIVNDQLLVAIRRTSDNLSEEKLRSFDIGYIANYPEQGLTFDLRLYKEQVRDGLEVFSEPIATSPLSDDDDITVIDNNIFNSDRKGIELQLQYRPDSSSLLSIQYAYTNLNGLPTPFDVPLENTHPTHTAGLLYSKQLTTKLTASGSVYFQDDVQWRGGGEHHSSFTRLDAQLSYQLKPGSMDGKISLVGQNLGAASYPDFRALLIIACDLCTT